ncbi:MAG: sugar phosphate isomerase/epimerase [Acidobacteria bacterium]|nr:sugar phosphate isomerase/epimerase [Acidobacteriota bacterium]
MNPIGIYYAYWTHDWRADFIPYISRVQRLGFDILEVEAAQVAEMTAVERQRLKDEAQRHRIELTACTASPREADLASADATERRRGVKFLQEQVRAMAATGVRQLGGVAYSWWPGFPPTGMTDKRPARDRSVKGMREVMKVAEDCGVFVNLEVLNRFEQYLLNTAGEGVDYCRRVGSPNCRLLLDVFHMNIEEDSFDGAFRTAGKHLGHVHLGETNRRLPGRGKIPWSEIFQALKRIGYTGPLVMEPFLMPGGDVGRDIRVYRDLRNGLNLDREAARACRFVRSCWEGICRA